MNPVSLRDTHRGLGREVERETIHDSDARDLAERAWDGAAESLTVAKAANDKATTALTTTAVVQGQFRTIIALLSAIGLLLAGVMGWVVLRVDTQAERAREAAEVAATQVVQRSDARFESRLSQIAQDAAREAVKLRDAQVAGMTVRGR